MSIDRFIYPGATTRFNLTLQSKNHYVAWRFTRVVADKCLTEKLYIDYLPALPGF
jgi:hypothetical protein